MKRSSLTSARARVDTLLSELEKEKRPFAIVQGTWTQSGIGQRGMVQPRGKRIGTLPANRETMCVQTTGQHDADR